MNLILKEKTKHRIIYAILILLVASSFVTLGYSFDLSDSVEKSSDKTILIHSIIENSLDVFLDENTEQYGSNNFYSEQTARPEFAKHSLRKLIVFFSGCISNTSTFLFRFQQYQNVFICILLSLLINIYFIHQQDGNK